MGGGYAVVVLRTGGMRRGEEGQRDNNCHTYVVISSVDHLGAVNRKNNKNNEGNCR